MCVERPTSTWPLELSIQEYHILFSVFLMLLFLEFFSFMEICSYLIYLYFFYGKLFSTGSLKLKRKVHPDINWFNDLSILIGTNLSNICQYFNDCIILSTWVILFGTCWLLVISLSVNCSSPYWKLGISRLFLKAFE